MKYWFDTEFIEDGKTIDLISIGIVCEDGRELYLINYDCDFDKASDWVKENVINQLPEKPSEGSNIIPPSIWRKKSAIAYYVAMFCGCEIIKKESLSKDDIISGKLWNIQLKANSSIPEFWAHYADYDWVVFCQLFGTMMDLPDGFPRYCKDLKQWCDDLGNPRLPNQVGAEHNALEDARWNKQIYDFLVSVKHGW